MLPHEVEQREWWGEHKLISYDFGDDAPNARRSHNMVKAAVPNVSGRTVAERAPPKHARHPTTVPQAAVALTALRSRSMLPPLLYCHPLAEHIARAKQSSAGRALCHERTGAIQVVI